jgi:integrase/recombinase XerD
MGKFAPPKIHTEVGDPRNPHGLFVAMTRYLDHLRIRGNTAFAVYNVERAIRDFIGWCDIRSLERPTQITRQILATYQRWLWYYRKKNGEPLSIYSQRAKLTPLRGLFKWLARNDYIAANPASELELPRAPHRLPAHVLTIEEAEHILTLPDTTNKTGLRDRAMMEVFYSTGMRRMELAQLKIEHLDLDAHTVFIHQGKGRKDRFIPLGSRASRWVKRYLEESRPKLVWDESERTVFLSRMGEPLAPCWLSSTIARYVKRSKVKKQGGCHLFRHTMATLMLEGGADVRYVQAMLGHERLSTTEIYTHVAIRQLRLIHEATHPANGPGPRGASVVGESDEAVAALFAVLADEAREERREDAASGDGVDVDAPHAV